jgi:hypothetical protein
MKSHIRRMLKLGRVLWSLLLSTTGCFVWMGGPGLVATERDGEKC